MRVEILEVYQLLIHDRKALFWDINYSDRSHSKVRVSHGWWTFGDGQAAQRRGAHVYI